MPKHGVPIVSKWSTVYLVGLFSCYTDAYHNKGKVISLQAWTGPEGSRRLKLPDFDVHDNVAKWHMNDDIFIKFCLECYIFRLTHKLSSNRNKKNTHTSFQWVKASSVPRFHDHTLRHNTLGGTPLDEWSTRRKHLYLTTHNIHTRHPCPPARFEPIVPAGERPQTHALDRALYYKINTLIINTTHC
jgi:hypothetical protein